MFYESLEGARSDGICSNPKFGTSHNVLFSGKDHVPMKNRFLILTHHQKVIKLTLLDQWN